jgi:hypothetical protein
MVVLGGGGVCQWIDILQPACAWCCMNKICLRFLDVIWFVFLRVFTVWTFFEQFRVITVPQQTYINNWKDIPSCSQYTFYRHHTNNLAYLILWLQKPCEFRTSCMKHSWRRKKRKIRKLVLVNYRSLEYLISNSICSGGDEIYSMCFCLTNFLALSRQRAK